MLDMELAFASDKSGHGEVYLRDLARQGDQLLVSNGGGVEPVWSPDGRELYYRENSADPYLVAVSIATMPAPHVLGRTRLFPIGDVVSTSPHATMTSPPTVARSRW